MHFAAGCVAAVTVGWRLVEGGAVLFVVEHYCLLGHSTNSLGRAIVGAVHSEMVLAFGRHHLRPERKQLAVDGFDT